MLVVTIQDIAVLEKKEEVITPNSKRNFPRLKPCYNRIESDYRNKKKVDTQRLFWGFTKIENLDASLEPSVILALHNNEGVLNGRNKVLLLLNIPEDELLFTDYDKYNNQLGKYLNLGFTKEFRYTKKDVTRIERLLKEKPYIKEYLPSNELLTDDWETIYDVQGSVDVQVLFPYIRKDQIVGMRFYNDEISARYPQYQSVIV